MASKSFEPALVLGLYTETPLHCGAESGVGYVDLPVQRERHTEYPVIPGSTIKGRLKDETCPKEGATEPLSEEQHQRLFGWADLGDTLRETRPGRLAFGDGVLVALPVRSTDRPFRWVTSPFAVERALRLLGRGADALETGPTAGEAWVCRAPDPAEVLLEEIVLTAVAKPKLFAAKGPLGLLSSLLPSEERGFSYTRRAFGELLTVIPDNDFAELARSATDVVTRIKLTALGTTTDVPASHELYDSLTAEERQGNLFVEEVVPSESLFIATVRSGDVVRDDERALRRALPPVVQLGGGETIGRGVTHLTVLADGKEEAGHGAS